MEGSASGPAKPGYHKIAVGRDAAAEAGGLLNSGAGVAEEFHLVGMRAGRILTGEKPADLPIIQPTKF
jgi:hypothetical protein